MATDGEALATFMTRLAAAATDFAQAIRAESEPPPPPEEDNGRAAETLGPRQQQAYQVLAAAGDGGVQTAEVARAMPGYDFSNAYLTLRRLVEMGVAEQVPGAKPQRYRLSQRHRGSSGPYLLAAQQLGPGEWATYGDISIALRGDDRAARAVGRAAATLPNFPAPHRVLKSGGVIPPEWHDSDGQGPDECRRRLEAEGVEFDGERADPRRRVSWEELRERLRAVGANVPETPDA